MVTDSGTVIRAPIPRAVAEPPDRRQHQGDDQQLPQLDPDVEAQQSEQSFLLGQTKLTKHPGEPKTVEQPEPEDDRRSPACQSVGQDVLDRHIDDGEGDQGFDNTRRQRHDLEDGERQCRRVGDSERAHLPDQRAGPGAEQDQTEHEQDVVEAPGDDVHEPELEILPANRQRGGRLDRATQG